MSKWTLMRYSGEEDVLSDPEQILAEFEILASADEPTADALRELHASDRPYDLEQIVDRAGTLTLDLRSAEGLAALCHRDHQ